MRIGLEEEIEPTGDGASEERQGRSGWRYHVTARSAEVVIDNALTLRPHWHGPMNPDEIRALVRMAAAAPALYEALKATSCRYSRARECVGPEMCDRCAALALVDNPQTKETK